MRWRDTASAAASAVLLVTSTTLAQDGEAIPTLVDEGLAVEPAVEGLMTPIGMAFLDDGSMLVIEKDTGKVLHVTDGEMTGEALDLSVNFASERGLLGIALHPEFPADPGVYLFWTCRASVPLDGDVFFPEEHSCSDEHMTGMPDTDDVLQVPLLGNRVDRFVWDGSSLVFERNLEMLLAFQNDAAAVPADQADAGQPARGNHDAGVLAFGPDGKLYVIFGDAGRRGRLQNLACGPTAPECPGSATADDQFGGPQPDDAHFTGVILRLNDDGTTPEDNPFFAHGEEAGGEIGENLQRIFAYGFRNSFGMAFDPVSGALWMQENGEDAWDELNLVEPGMNSGWIQVAGPSGRVDEFKSIETTSTHHEETPNLQQLRWDPSLIADSPDDALSRLFELPGSTYSDPEFSWKYVLAPAGIGFAGADTLGDEYAYDLFVGFSTTDMLGGPLFRFDLTVDRQGIAPADAGLEDGVADNIDFHEMTENESLVFGEDFGIVTDIEPGPNGELFVVSLDHGAIYEISAR